MKRSDLRGYVDSDSLKDDDDSENRLKELHMALRVHARIYIPKMEIRIKDDYRIRAIEEFKTVYFLLEKAKRFKNGDMKGWEPIERPISTRNIEYLANKVHKCILAEEL